MTTLKRPNYRVDELEEFIACRFPGARTATLSNTNNDLVKIDTGPGQALVVKKVTDSDIPVCYMLEVNRRLSAHLAVQETIEAIYRPAGSSFIVSPFLEGETLFDLVQQNDQGHGLEGLVDFLLDFTSRCADLPRLGKGFGLFKNNAPLYETPLQFMLAYANKYWSRIRPTLQDQPMVDWVDQWLHNGLIGADAGGAWQTVAIDVNLKNFLRLEDATICILNVPIVGFSTRAHGIGATHFHLRYSAIGAAYWQAATRELSKAEQYAVLQLELWHVLGVMSFYASREPESWQTWRNWGSSVTLIQHLRDLVKLIKHAIENNPSLALAGTFRSLHAQ